MSNKRREYMREYMRTPEMKLKIKTKEKIYRDLATNAKSFWRTSDIKVACSKLENGRYTYTAPQVAKLTNRSLGAVYKVRKRYGKTF